MEMNGKWIISYRWRWWETWHRRYFDTKTEANDFINSMMANPNWKPYGWLDT
jgi:hypothetical protein